MLGQVPAGLVTAVSRPVALERFCRRDVFTLERILPTGATKLLVDREGRAANIANLLVPQLKQMVHKQQRAAVMVGIDCGHARMRIHGNDDRANARQWIKRLKIGSHTTHADNDAVHGQRGHTTRCLGKREFLGLGHLDQRDGAIMLASSAGDAVDH